MPYGNRNWVAVEFRCLLMNDLLLLVAGFDAASDIVFVFVCIVACVSAAATAATGAMHFGASDQISNELFLFPFCYCGILVEFRCSVCP